MTAEAWLEKETHYRANTYLYLRFYQGDSKSEIEILAELNKIKAKVKEELLSILYPDVENAVDSAVYEYRLPRRLTPGLSAWSLARNSINFGVFNPLEADVAVDNPALEDKIPSTRIRGPLDPSQILASDSSELSDPPSNLSDFDGIFDVATHKARPPNRISPSALDLSHTSVGDSSELSDPPSDLESPVEPAGHSCTADSDRNEYDGKRSESSDSGDEHPPARTAPPSTRTNHTITLRSGRMLPLPNENEPTGQHLNEFETAVFEDGKWYVVFEKTWISAVTTFRYRQVDELPTYDLNAEIPELAEGEKDAYIQHPGGLPTISKLNEGHWEQVEDNGALGVWHRIHDPSQAREIQDAEPKLIMRKFHRLTHCYLDLYKMGDTWEAWEPRVAEFNMNDLIKVRRYSRWVQQLMKKHHFEYQGRLNANLQWTETEIEAFRRHFNELINSKGVVEALLHPDWKHILSKVNNAREEKKRQKKRRLSCANCNLSPRRSSATST